MGDPVTIGLMVASTMLTAKAQRAQGEALAQQASFERQQAEEQAEMARIRGIDDEAERRKDFARHAATERAFTAAAGVRNFLGSPQRLQDEARTQLGRDITKIKLNTATFRRDAQITGAAAAFPYSNRGQYSSGKPCGFWSCASAWGNSGFLSKSERYDL